jgi:O-antigen ligase
MGGGIAAMLMARAVSGYKLRQLSVTRFTVGCLLAVVTLAVAVQYSDKLVEWLNENVLLTYDKHRGLGSGATGRTEVWNDMLDAWKQSPFFGEGYMILRKQLSGPTDGGYFRALAETGMVGLLGCVLFLAIAGWSAFRNVLELRTRVSHSHFAFVTAFALLNIFESRLQSSANPATTLYLVMVFYLLSHRPSFVDAVGRLPHEPRPTEGSYL